MRRLSSQAFRVLLGGWLCITANAHDGPEHEIEALTEQMTLQGEAPDLLIQRAIEFNVLGKFSEAAQDLERAAVLEPSSPTVQRELSQAYFSLGKTNEALSTATRALRSFQGTPGEEASLFVTRAAIWRARQDFQKALSDVESAIGRYPDNVEWYLIRSELQALLQRKRERVNGLAEGMQVTGSGLLAAEWVDALIDDGQHASALAQIHRELEQARWKSAWLIRRAKVSRAQGKAEAARQDLQSALDELNARLRVSAADALLLAERGEAYALLAKKDEARRDYRAARDKGLTGEWLRRRLDALRAP